MPIGKLQIILFIFIFKSIYILKDFNISIIYIIGDGPLGAFTFTIINNVSNQLQVHTLESYENIHTIVLEAIDSLGDDATIIEKNIERARLEEYVFSRINVARDYFHDHFIETNDGGPPRIRDNNMGHLHVMFESFALTDPEHLNRMFQSFQRDNQRMILYIREKLEILVNMDRINVELSNSLIGSIGPYLALSANFTYGDDVKQHDKYRIFIEFWKREKYNLVHWFEFVKVTLLHHPNSCGSERLFSLLKYVMETHQNQCLDDYICASVYAAYEQQHDADRLLAEA